MFEKIYIFILVPCFTFGEVDLFGQFYHVNTYVRVSFFLCVQIICKNISPNLPLFTNYGEYSQKITSEKNIFSRKYLNSHKSFILFYLFYFENSLSPILMDFI